MDYMENILAAIFWTCLNVTFWLHSEGASAGALLCELWSLKVGEGSLECGFSDTAHPPLEPRLESLQMGKGLSCQNQLPGSLLPLWLRIQSKL